MPSTPTAPFAPGSLGAAVLPAMPPAPTATAVPPAAASSGEPTEDDIRSYANHLYRARGSTDGHDGEDWLEAEACLRANIPREAAHTRVHHHTLLTARAVVPLIKHGRS